MSHVERNSNLARNAVLRELEWRLRAAVLDGERAGTLAAGGSTIALPKGRPVAVVWAATVAWARGIARYDARLAGLGAFTGEQRYRLDSGFRSLSGHVELDNLPVIRRSSIEFLVSPGEWWRLPRMLTAVDHPLAQMGLEARVWLNLGGAPVDLYLPGLLHFARGIADSVSGQALRWIEPIDNEEPTRLSRSYGRVRLSGRARQGRYKVDLDEATAARVFTRFLLDLRNCVGEFAGDCIQHERMDWLAKWNRR